MQVWQASLKRGAWLFESHTLHRTPYTIHRTPYTLHPTPYTLLPTPYTLHPTPFTLITSAVHHSIIILRSVPPREKGLYWQPTGSNPLNCRQEFSRPALRHGSTPDPPRPFSFEVKWRGELKWRRVSSCGAGRLRAVNSKLCPQERLSHL